MTPSEEKDLWVRFKEQGDANAREKLVISYMRVVKYVAGRMAIHVPPCVEMDDLVGWGVLGLLDAVEKFDHRQDIKFSTYASIRVRGAVLDQIRAMDWAPRSLRAMARKINNAKVKLRHTGSSEPSIEDIASEVGATPEQVEDAVSQLQTAQILSLDDYVPSEEGSGVRKVDVTGDAGAVSPDHSVLGTERQERLVEAILQLPDQQQKVLNLYYYEELTLKEIGAVLEVTESRICQIHGAAMKALRKAIRQGDV